MTPAPFYNHDFFGLFTGLAIAVLIGVGFGFSLERGGFGSSRRLAAQFYLYDMTVFKVMFTAIITAMVGLYGLSRVGFVDIDLVWINPTFLWPQIVGGLLLGVGFIVSGYCPGTSIVAAASGKIDALFTILGVFIGIFLFGLAYVPAVEAFHQSGSMDRLTLYGLLGVDPLLLALGVVIMAGAAFIGAEWVEKRFTRFAEPGRLTAWKSSARWAVVSTVVLAGLVFLLLPARPAMTATAMTTPSHRLSAMQLANDIVQATEPLFLVDIRAASLFEAGSVPGSVNLSPEELGRAETWADQIPAGHRVVLIDNGDSQSLQQRVPVQRPVAALEGGYPAWKALLETSADDPSVPAQELALRQSLIGFFSGATSGIAPAAAATPKAGAPAGGKKKRGGGC